VSLLPRNHELAQWTAQRIGKGDEDYNEVFRQGVATAYGKHADAVYQAYLELIAVLPMALRTPNRVFLSHSLPAASRLEAFDTAVLERDDCRPEDLRLGGALHGLVWGRDTGPGPA